MKAFSLKSHHPGRAVQPSAFFVQSRGRNTGRPSFVPRRNCYVLHCDEQVLHATFWLVYALWRAGYFRQRLRGNGTPFMRVRAMRTLIARALQRHGEQPAPVDLLRKGLQTENRLQKELQKVSVMRNNLLDRYFQQSA